MVPNYPLPENEAERLRSLRSYRILDTPPEQYFDDITHIASMICETPIAIISLIDQERQWFKSSVGLDASESSRDIAFCTYTILRDRIMEVGDAAKDERFAGNPFVTSDPRIRFYAGTPLINDQSHALGSLCVIDREPRTLTPEQKATLAALGRQVVALMELHKSHLETQRLAQLKDEIIRVASHDLKNPVQVIRTTSDRLYRTTRLKAPLKPDQFDNIKTIRLQADILNKTIVECLDFHAIEEGRIRLSTSNVDLNALCTTILETHQSAAEARKVSLVTHFKPDLPSVQADSMRLDQVLSHLIDSAIRFSPDQSEVHLSSTAGTSGPRLSIRDSGPSLSADDLTRLFRYRANLSNRPAPDKHGAGLGLSICKSLVELHGGSIGAYNHPDGGVTFWFEIPSHPS